LSRDYTKTNYSSARAASASTQKSMNARKKFVADRMADDTFALWLEEEFDKGWIPLPRGVGKEFFYLPFAKEALTQAQWIGAGRGQIDELKETQAAILRINGGLSTYEAEIAQLGGDYRRTFRQRAREEQLKTELNLTFSSDPGREGQQEAGNTLRNGGAEREDKPNE
jgi:capsid protein